MNSISGVSFAAAWKTRISESLRINGETITLPYIGLEALIKNKRSVSRDKDKEDLAYLEAAWKKSKRYS